LIEEEVLRVIKPSKEEEERIRSKIEIVMELLKEYDIEIHGSFRKGTWLKGDTDVDLFVFFNKDFPRENFIKVINEIKDKLKGIKTKIGYADHPYLIAILDDVEIDIVPAIRVESGDRAITPVDRTPFHTQYVITHLDERGKDEVRLLKQFMKGIGVYGAEIKVEGFSGYVAELLIIHFGSFRKVLEEASKWKPPVKVFLTKPQKDFESPLIIPDPVDPKRNAGSAVSLRRLAEFSLAARYYLRNPSINFFFPLVPKYGIIKGDVFLVKLISETSPPDVFWGQVKRSMRRIKKALELVGYKVIDIQAWGGDNDATIGVQLESKIIGEYYVLQGPPFYIRDNVDEFIKENENVWVGDDGRLYTIKRRKEIDIQRIVLNQISVDNLNKVEFHWLNEVPEDKNLWRFLKKTPEWLK